jgi:hypothetical protein
VKRVYNLLELNELIKTHERDETSILGHEIKIKKKI